MPSSYSASLRLELQAAGENLNTWGAPRLNNVIARMDKAIAGRAVVPLTGAAYALTTSNTADDEARAAMLEFTGTGATVTLPSVSKTYIVQNSCASGAVVLTTGAGGMVTVDPGDIIQVTCDGTNVETLGFSVGGIALSLKDYIASVVVGGGTSLPSVVGQSGKFLTNNGTTPLWRAPVVGDLTDYVSDQATRRTSTLASAAAASTPLAIAFAFAL